MLGKFFYLIFAIVWLSSVAKANFPPCAISVPAYQSHSDLTIQGALETPLVPLADVIDSVVVVLRSRGHFLMGLRTGGTGEGTWGFIGGKLDRGESVDQAARRENFEEIGVGLGALRWLHTSYDYRPEVGKWFRVFFLEAVSFEGTPKILEPHKMLALEWFNPYGLPLPMFPSNLDFVLNHLPD